MVGSPAAVNALPLVQVPGAVIVRTSPAVTVTPVACHIASTGGLHGGCATMVTPDVTAGVPPPNATVCAAPGS